MNAPEHVEGQAGDPRDRLIGQFELLERDDVPESQVLDQLFAPLRIERLADDVHVNFLSWGTNADAPSVA